MKPWRHSFTAMARLQSLKTIEGDFPPNSRVTRFNVFAAARLILIPVATLPVKEIYSCQLPYNRTRLRNTELKRHGKGGDRRLCERFDGYLIDIRMSCE